MNYATLQKWLGVEFRNNDLLVHALTHRSYWNDDKDNRVRRSNERLEFLGDAVLELIITDSLYATFPDKTEGDLTAIRSRLVSAENLATVGEGGDIYDNLLMSKGERKSETIRGRQILVANAMESLMGALYLDQGLPAVTAFVKRRVLTHVEQVASKALDPKSVLQAKAQEHMKVTPTYQNLEASGPDHARRFVVGVYISGTLTAKGHGPSKRDAEVKAAEAALIMRGWAPSPI
jgi:ribonuclease III